jgi:hypothetical protein
MQTFLDYLNEKRTNPDQNPKIDLVTSLKPYKNDSNIYISYTAIDKIGVNPHSSESFNTPIGIYCYPLKEMWADVENNSVPFEGNDPAKFVWVIKSKSPLQDLGKSKYTSKDLDKDLAKLLKVSDSKELLSQIFIDGEKGSYVKTPGGIFWNITRIIAANTILSKSYVKGSSAMMRWGHLLRWLGYSGFVDRDGDKIIHRNEPIQAVMLSKNAFTVVNKVLNKRYTKTDASGRMVSDGVWYSGSWFGTWESGLWRNGIFKDGVWKNGTWKQGVWKNGTWKQGDWESGTWENGTWENGTWVVGSWKNGTWKQGDWESGYWEKGVWEDGVWTDGLWYNGEWKFGIWKYGQWNNGIWHYGWWHNGVWKNGTWVNGTWKKGIWNKGVWKNGIWEDGHWKNGIWENGSWRDGVWKDGTWRNGTWHKGLWDTGIWTKGEIYSNKFKVMVKSSIDPKNFYSVEAKTQTLNELKDWAIGKNKGIEGFLKS